MTDDRSVYEYRTRVYGYDADRENRMKLSSLLRAVQTIASFHLDANGMAFDDLSAKGSVFIMTKVSVTVFRTPKREEPIILKTWTRGLEGIVFLRDTTLESEDGERLADVTANWILVDPEKHGILRPEALSYSIAFRPDRALLSTRPGRLRCPKEKEYAGEKTVRYTDLDFLGHLNNTNYADIVTDFLPDAACGAEFSEFDVAFHSEAKLGEKIEIFRTEKDGVLYFTGEHGRGKCFEARVVCKPRGSSRARAETGAVSNPNPPI